MQFKLESLGRKLSGNYMSERVMAPFNPLKVTI